MVMSRNYARENRLIIENMHFSSEDCNEIYDTWEEDFILAVKEI